MANEYFTASGNPATRATATSASMRAEFAAIVAGFDKLPTMTGNGGKLLVVNSAGTALVVSTSVTESSGNVGFGTTSPAKPIDATSAAADATAIRVRGRSADNIGSIEFTSNSGATQYGYIQGRSGYELRLASNATGFVTAYAGGAERLRIDASGNVGIGTTTSATALGFANGAQISWGASNYAYVSGSNATNVLTFGTQATERMRIDASGNVGVGTASPAYKVHVNATGNTQVCSEGTTDASFITRMSGVQALYLHSTTGMSEINELRAVPLTVSVNGAERMRIDASGNAGLGVTPSAWTTGYKAFEFGYNALASADNATVHLTLNGYYNAGWKYKNNGNSNLYSQINGGGHAWYIAPSGTAGNAITWTQAMTLDASGNVGVGVTPSAWGSNFRGLQVGAVGSVSYDNNFGQVYLGTNMYMAGAGAGTPTYLTTNAAARFDVTQSGFQWRQAGSGTAGATITWTTAMTLDANGRLKAGTTGNPVSSLIRLLVQGDATTGGAVELVANGGGGVVFDPIAGGGVTISRFTGAVGAETYTSSLIVDSSGIFKIGNATTMTATGSDGITAMSVSPGSACTVVVQNNSGPNYYASKVSGYSNNQFMSFNVNGANVGLITTNGTTTTYATSSDARLKENVEPAMDSGALIDAVNVVAYDWKSNGAHVSHGVIAQQLYSVFPDAVVKGNDGEEISDPWGVDLSHMIPLLIKELQTLRARVANLEAA